MSTVAGPPFDWRTLFGDNLQYGLSPTQKQGKKEEGDRLRGERERERERETESPGEYIQWPETDGGQKRGEVGDGNLKAAEVGQEPARGQRVDTASTLCGKYVGIFFSGHW